MKIFIAMLAGGLAFGALPARAETPAAETPAPTAQYAPELADIMTTAQWRHLKLSYAGALHNWTLAEFEVGQMRKSFAAASKHYPEYENVPVAALIEKFSAPALADLDKAIHAKDAGGFFKAFERLNAACNSCHQSAGRPFIKIRTPTSSPFSNQVFRPEN
jgi:hypothetical protein